MWINQLSIGVSVKAFYSRTSGKRRFRSVQCRTAGSARCCFWCQTRRLQRVSLAMFSLSFKSSYTILIMPSTVMVSFVTTRRQSGYAVASSVLKASPFIWLLGWPSLMPCFSYTSKIAGKRGASSRKISARSKFSKRPKPFSESRYTGKPCSRLHLPCFAKSS